MASEISVDSFLNLLRQSGLVSDDPMLALKEELESKSPKPSTARQLADELVQRNILTQWQADMLLQGKHRGFRLGPHRILCPLGHGGMSKVFLAEHELMRRRCAIKVLPAKYQDDAELLSRFHLEARAIAALDHPHIVRAYDFNKDVRYGKEIHYLVMEYVEGQDLRRMVEEQGPLDPRKAADLIRQAAEGLSHAHELGFVHRDVKPANLLVDPNGLLKILDLGLARFTFEGEQAWQTSEGEQSAVGTADYVAPEQVMDSRNVDGRADIYSLGHTFYFLLTGRRPFPKSTLVELLKAHQSEKPEPITNLRPDVPLELVDIFERMTAKKPAQRFQSAKEVSDALQTWLRNSSSSREYSRISALMQAAMRAKHPTAGDAAGTPAQASGNTDLELAFLDDEPNMPPKPAEKKPTDTHRAEPPAKQGPGSSAKIKPGSAPKMGPVSPSKAGPGSSKTKPASPLKVAQESTPKKAAGSSPKMPAGTLKAQPDSKPSLSPKSPGELVRAEELPELVSADLILADDELAAAAQPEQSPLGQPVYRRSDSRMFNLKSPWLWVAVGGLCIILLLIVVIVVNSSSDDDYHPIAPATDQESPVTVDQAPDPKLTTDTEQQPAPPQPAPPTVVQQPPQAPKAPPSNEPPPFVMSPVKPPENNKPAAQPAKPAPVRLDRNKLIAGIKTLSFRLQSFDRDPAGKLNMMVRRQASEAARQLDLGVGTGDLPLLDIELKGGSSGDSFNVVIVATLKVRIPGNKTGILWTRSQTLASMPARKTPPDQALKVLRPNVDRFFDEFVDEIKQARSIAASH